MSQNNNFHFLDAVCSQIDLAEKIFHEGVARGFYAKVSRLGTQWLELDLHFLSLGGGETALRWWFEKCLVPYLGDSSELASVKSIDIVTGYGKTRARGARKGDDSMRKRVRAMLSFMNVGEVVQPNLGRIHIDKQALMKEVERNGGRIIFDANGYEQFKLQEGLDEPYSDVPQFVRPRGGALHDRTERDRKQSSLPGPNNWGNANYNTSGPRGIHNDVSFHDNRNWDNSPGAARYQGTNTFDHPSSSMPPNGIGGRPQPQSSEWQGSNPNSHYPGRQSHIPQTDLDRDYRPNSWQSQPRNSYSEREGYINNGHQSERLMYNNNNNMYNHGRENGDNY